MSWCNYIGHFSALSTIFDAEACVTEMLCVIHHNMVFSVSRKARKGMLPRVGILLRTQKLFWIQAMEYCGRGKLGEELLGFNSNLLFLTT